MIPFADVLAVLLTAAILLAGVFLIIKAFLDKQLSEEKLQKTLQISKEVLPLRLQAYERICIYLERMSPNNLIVRLNDRGYNVAQFQEVLLNEIRGEFNHNLSQQVYVSEEAWDYVRKSTEELIALVNNAAHELEREAPSIELAKKIFEKVLERQDDLISGALKYVKREIQEIF